MDYFPIEDGYAQERSILDDVLSSVGSKELWVADSGFCTLKFMYRIQAAGSCFVIRQHGSLEGTIKESSNELVSLRLQRSTRTS